MGVEEGIYLKEQDVDEDKVYIFGYSLGRNDGIPWDFLQTLVVSSKLEYWQGNHKEEAH